MMMATFLLLLSVFGVCLQAVDLTSPVSDPRQEIVAVGLQAGSLLFLTRDNKKYFTYLYPAEAIDAKRMKVSSTNVTMGKVSASLIKLGRQRIISGALVKSANHHDVLFAVRKDWRNTLDSGFFDFNSTNDIFVESPFAWMTNVLCISSSEAETMYTLQVEPVIALQKVAFKNQLNESNRDITDSNLLKPISQKLNFCFDPLTNDNVQHFMLSADECDGSDKNKHRLNINTGFLLNDEQFFLFGPDKVYSFSKVAFDKPKTKVKLTWILLKEFFSSRR